MKVTELEELSIFSSENRNSKFDSMAHRNCEIASYGIHEGKKVLKLFMFISAGRILKKKKEEKEDPVDIY